MNQLLTIFLAAQPSAGQNSGSSLIGTFLPLVLIIVVFYFFMIRPQMKRQKEARKFREALKKGDSVLTTGGIYGKITEVGDTWVMLEIGKEVNIKIEKGALISDPSGMAENK